MRCGARFQESLEQARRIAAERNVEAHGQIRLIQIAPLDRIQDRAASLRVLRARQAGPRCACGERIAAALRRRHTVRRALRCAAQALFELLRAAQREHRVECTVLGEPPRRHLGFFAHWIEHGERVVHREREIRAGARERPGRQPFAGKTALVGEKPDGASWKLRGVQSEGDAGKKRAKPIALEKVGRGGGIVDARRERGAGAETERRSGACAGRESEAVPGRERGEEGPRPRAQTEAVAPRDLHGVVPPEVPVRPSISARRRFASSSFGSSWRRRCRSSIAPVASPLE